MQDSLNPDEMKDLNATEALSTEDAPGTDAEEMLRNIERLAQWGGRSEEENREFDAIQILFTTAFPERAEEMRKKVQAAEAFVEFGNLAYKHGNQGDPFSVIETHPSFGKLEPGQRGKIIDQYAKGCKARRRRESEQKAIKSGRPLSTVHPRQQARRHSKSGFAKPKGHKEIQAPEADLHSNDLRSLAPAAKWTLVIDESGKVFDSAPGRQIDAVKAGRFVGVLIPDNALAPLKPRWHAVEVDRPEEIDGVVQAVLDASVGVFGIEAEVVPYSPGDRWLDGIAQLLDWVLRLMPVDGPTKLEVLIEQRGDFNKTQPWDLIRRDALYRLALSFPERAAQIHLVLRSIGKAGSPLNGYADALAFTWAQSTRSSRERLKRSKLADSCLLSSKNGLNYRRMREAWDAFSQGVQLEPEHWWDWVSQPDARNPASLLHSFLNSLTSECRETPHYWQRFLSEVKRRMARSPVDLQRLGAAVDWLELCRPDGETLPPVAEMIWLTVLHARANHEGQIAVHQSRRLPELERALFDEEAPLVCHAQLHRAVQLSNRFEFAKAQSLLEPWLNHPAAVPGLRYHAHVLSSLGQLAAFQGRMEDAKGYFNRALPLIDRLSDRALALLDEAQTRAYLAIVLMDDPQVPDALSKEQLFKVIGPLEKAAALSTSGDVSRRYSLHLLLRWLCVRGDQEIASQALDCMEKWHTGEGHPWPLIQLYRGILMLERDKGIALQLFEEAATLAEQAQQGPTVALIGACIRNVAVAHGGSWPGKEQMLEKLRKQLPAAADRIDLIQSVPKPDRRALLDFLASVLPFNFH